MKKILLCGALGSLLLSAISCTKKESSEKDYPKIIANKWRMDSVIFEYYNLQTNQTQWINQIQSNDSVTSYSIFETGGKFYQIVHHLSSNIDSILDDNDTWSVSGKNMTLHMTNGVNLTYNISLLNNNEFVYKREDIDTARSANGTPVGVWKSICFYNRK